MLWFRFVIQFGLLVRSLSSAPRVRAVGWRQVSWLPTPIMTGRQCKIDFSGSNRISVVSHAPDRGRRPKLKSVEISGGAAREGHHLLGQSLRLAFPLFAAPFGISSHTHTRIRAYVQTSIHTHTHTCILTYTHTCILTYTHTYLHTHLHTYTHTQHTW